MTPAGILETVLYAKDLVAIEAFYRDVLSMQPFAKADGRHLFYRCGDQVLLIFNPQVTTVPPTEGALPVPPHGLDGEGHVCFRASAAEKWARTLRIQPAELRDAQQNCDRETGTRMRQSRPESVAFSTSTDGAHWHIGTFPRRLKPARYRGGATVVARTRQRAPVIRS